MPSINNNNEYLERLTCTGPKRLHVLYKYILSKFNAYNMNTHTHTRTHIHRFAHARIQIQPFQLVVTMISFVYHVFIFSIHMNLSVSALTEVLHDVRNCPVDPRLVVVPDSISSLTATEKKESSWWTVCVSLYRGTKDHEQGWTVFRVRNFCIFFSK